MADDRGLVLDPFFFRTASFAIIGTAQRDAHCLVQSSNHSVERSLRHHRGRPLVPISIYQRLIDFLIPFDAVCPLMAGRTMKDQSCRTPFRTPYRPSGLVFAKNGNKAMVNVGELSSASRSIHDPRSRQLSISPHRFTAHSARLREWSRFHPYGICET